MNKQEYKKLPPSTKLRVAVIDPDGFSEEEVENYQKLIGFEFTRGAGRCGDEYISLTSHPMKPVCNILYLLFSEVEVVPGVRALL